MAKTTRTGPETASHEEDSDRYVTVEVDQSDMDDLSGDLVEEEAQAALFAPATDITVKLENITAYVSSDELDDVTIVEQTVGDEIPDIEFMTEFLVAQELDERKKQEFISYISKLDADALQSLWEAMKGSYGASPEVITATDLVTRRIQSVEESQSLRLRDTAVDKELARMGTIASQLQRMLRISMSDTPLSSFRVDHLSAYIHKLQRDSTTMNAAVVGMAEMLLIGHSDMAETSEMAINPERVAQICAIVGHSAKGWAKVYTVAEQERLKLLAEIKTLKDTLKTAHEAQAVLQRQLMQEKARIDGLTLHATSYFIGNHSGNFITTVNKPEDDCDWYRIGQYNLRITQDRSEAFTHDDIEVMRKVYDAVLDWSKKSIRVRKLFKDAGVNAETLFISGESLVRVV